MKIKVITNAWIDRKVNELYDLGCYKDDMALWTEHAINKAEAEKFIRKLLSELP